MTQSKEPRNEKLINDLYEKLNWYTFEASDEQFDEKEVDAIVQLLDVLEPMKEDPRYPSDPAAARDRFYKRFGLEEEMSGLRDSGCENMETEPAEQKGKKKKVFVRFVAGLAACLVLMLSVNVGCYALKEKSFFEVVRDGIGRTKVTVTGNVEGMDDSDTDINKYDSWTDVKTIVEDKILLPSYIPKEFNLDEIVINNTISKKSILAKYTANGKILTYEINIYPQNYYERYIQYDDDWELIDEEGDNDEIQYYSKGGQTEALFTYNNGIYLVRGDVTLSELKSIVHNLE